MMDVKSSWNGAREHKAVVAAGWDRILRAAVFFWNACQTALNVSNPRPYTNSAAKGEPPRKRTGFGAKNVIYKADKDKQEVRVGVFSNALYMAVHELKDHPWLLATLKKVEPQLKRIIDGGKAT